MTIDKISETLGSINAHLAHQSKAIDNLQESTTEMKEGMIRGAARMTAMEVRLDEIEPTLDDHVASCLVRNERKIGADLYRKMVWAGIWTVAGGSIMAVMIALFRAAGPVIYAMLAGGVH